MSGHIGSRLWGPTSGWGLAPAIAGASLASFATALTQHAATTRADAVAVVPIALGWAAIALVGGRLAARSPDLAPGWLLFAALATRLPLWGTPWHLSDDAWRYLWEGSVLAAGLDPFAAPPAALSGLDDALRDRVNHPEISSIYPPFALLWFRLLHALGGTPLAAQVTTTVADLVALFALRALTRDARWPAWVWALHPLPAVEAACSAHLEAPALALAGLGLVAWSRSRDDLAWFGVGGAALVKVLPVVVLPVMAWRLVRSRRGGAGVLVLAAAAAAAAWPVAGSGWALVRGFTAYATAWSFNGLLWPWLDPWLASGTRPALVVAAGAWVGWISWRDREPLAVFAAAGAAFVLTSPTAHPWYGLWALWPALALGRPGWAAAAGFLTCGYAVLATWDPATGSWSEPIWLWWITWPPLLGALAITTHRPALVADPPTAQVR